MSQAHTAVFAALKTVHTNAHSVTLPPAPTWPAIVYRIESEREPGWCAGGAPDLHTVTVLAFAVTQAEAVSLRNAALAALEALPSHYGEPSLHDAEYEEHPDVFGQALEVTLRMRSTP